MSRKILIGMDLTQLYHTAKLIRLNVSYKELVAAICAEVVDADEEVEVSTIGFTKFSQGNTGQVEFVRNLREVGIDVRTYPVTHSGGFDVNILAEALSVDADELVLVSNTAAALEAAEQLMRDEEPAMVVSVAYFSEDIPTRWVTKLLSPATRRTFSFIDLSEETVRAQIGRRSTVHIPA